MIRNKSARSNNGNKTADGRFGNGNTYGKGRPQGSRNKATLALEAGLFDHATPITKKIIDKALAGDVACLKMCMDRVYPVPRERPIVTELPAIHTVNDAINGMFHLLLAISRGQLTVGEAKPFYEMLNQTRKLLMERDELTELKERQDAIHRRLDMMESSSQGAP